MKSRFFIGFFLGVVIATGIALAFSTRYKIARGGNHTYRLDRWTGRTWLATSRGDWEEWVLMGEPTRAAGQLISKPKPYDIFDSLHDK